MNKRVKPIAEGGFIVSLYAVLALIDTITGGAFDVLISYVMIVPLIWYQLRYSIKESLLVVVTTGVVLFMIGHVFSLIFTIPTLLLGVFYAEMRKKNKSEKLTYLGLCAVSIFKNLFIVVFFSGLLGNDIMSEAYELLDLIGKWFPMAIGIISPNIVAVGALLLIVVGEAYLVITYGNLLIHLINKKK